MSHQKPTERTSPVISKGSMTVEAALTLPMFFFGMLVMVFLFEIFSIRLTVKSAMFTVGREIAQEAYVNRLLDTKKMERQLVKYIGEERLERSMVWEGKSGLHCDRSLMTWSTAVLHFSVSYQMKVPALGFQIPIITCEETLKMKGWTGYSGDGFWNQSEEEMVYVTVNGLVYHKSLQCSYLDLSVQGVPIEQVLEIRNQSGGRYSPCERCWGKHSSTGMVYITLYGTRYHSSLECSSLKRRVYQIPLSQAFGKGGCSKCVN